MKQSAGTEVFGSSNSLVYLDNAATTFPKPEEVYRKADEFYRQYGGNAGRGNNPLARACANLLDDTRSKVAAWLDAPSPDRVIFTSSATHALNLAIFGYKFRPDDIIYVTPFEHNSVLRPAEHLRQTQGVQIRQIPFNHNTYACELEELEAAFQVEPPTMVCMTQASNVCGVMPPITEIARLAKSINSDAVIIVDGAQTAGLYPLPMQEGLIDALVFSGHKSFYALYGVAGVILGTNWRPNPLLFGGTGTISESVQMPGELPSAYEAGSQNMMAIAGLNAATDWLQATGREQISKYTTQLAWQIRDQLQKHPEIEILAPDKDLAWSGIISFRVYDVTPQMMETSLGANDIAVRAGLHCAPWTHKWLKTIRNGGTVRLSPGFFNDSQDIERLIEVIKGIL